MARESEEQLQDRFARVARRCSEVAGHPAVFAAAVLLVLGWAVSGPVAGFGNTWQLVINTVTTILTFLMVFLIQNTQNRDSEAVHLKLDELLRALEGAREDMIDAERATRAELDEHEEDFREIARAAHRELDSHEHRVEHERADR